MKTTVLASTLLIGFAITATSASANITTIETINVSDLSTATPGNETALPLLHNVKNKHSGGHRGGGNRGGRDRNNLASDGNIGNGTLRARIQHEQRYSTRKFGNGSSSSGPFTFFRRIFGN